jgi:signal transduction histidine kinase
MREEMASRARIAAAADEARRRIERDLHDGMQQRLVSLELELRGAEASLPPEQQELRKELSRVADGLRDAQENLREISRGVHPAILSERGLGPSIKALARRSPVPVELEVHVEDRLPDHIELGAYYVVSEALANIAKHANASLASVRVDSVKEFLHLSIRDDGVGGANLARGSGLTGLMERVQALGGAIRIVSPAGEGTRMVVELPKGGN